MAETTVEEREQEVIARKARADALIAEVKKADEKPKYPHPEVNSEYRKIHRVMTLEDLALSRTSSVREARCILYSKNSYHNEDGSKPFLFLSGDWDTNPGHDPSGTMVSAYNIDTAAVLKVLDVIKHKKYLSSSWSVGLIDEEAIKNEPKRKNYKVEELINETLLNLGRIAPTNPTFRAHLLSLFGQMPPVELKTWEQVKEWMEFMPIPSFHETRQVQYSRRSQPQSSLDQRMREQRRQNEQENRAGRPIPLGGDDPTGFIATAIYEEVAIGRCTYRVRRRGENVQHEITGHWLATMVRDGLRIDDIMSRLTSEVRNNAETSDLQDIEGSESYADHECDETDELEMRPNTSQIRAELESWIRRNYGTEEAQTIIGHQ